jgi:ubiquinol-cytochrome c reductase cytochrome b subunit
MIDYLAAWLNSRTRGAKFARTILNHVFPDHWSFMLGEIAFYCFVILVMTGVFLAMFFNGSTADVVYHGSYTPLVGRHMSAAYQSMLHLSFDVPMGLVIRQMHHWAADIFIAAIVAHLCRIFFTAAFRKPREINWMIGLTLLVLALANGFFGYSLGDDLLSGAGLRIGYSILLSIPVIGPWLCFLFFGGTVPITATIPRFYALHIFVVPALISVLLAAHLGLIWWQMHTNLPGKNRTDKLIVGSRMWPAYTLKSMALFFLLFAIVAGLGGLVQIDPIWIYGPYKAVAILPGAQPDWYLGWIEGAMRLFPGVNLRLWGMLVPEIFFPAVLFPGLLFLLLYIYPFLDKWIMLDFREHNVLRLPWEQPFNTSLGCAILALLTVLLFAGGDDIIAVAMGSSVVWIRSLLRWLFFAVPVLTGAIVYFVCRAKLRRHQHRVSPTEEREMARLLTGEEPKAQAQD